MKRSDIDRAIVDLHRVLQEKASREAAFQAWAEDHAAVVSAALGYKRAIPHPQLHREDGELFIPDFVCENNNGIWEIVELKTAEPAIYKEKDRRRTFYQAIDDCIAQCKEYSKWMSHAPAKQEFETQYGAKLSYQPGALIIAGGSSDYDRHAVAEDLGSRTPPMRLHSWEDVQDQLLRFRATMFGDVASAVGCSAILSLRIERQPDHEPMPLVDVGVEEDANRVTLYVDNKRGMTLRVVLANGSVQHISLPGESFRFGRDVIVAIEVVSAPDFVRIGLDIDRHEAFSLRLSSGEFVLSNLNCITLGAKMSGGPGATFYTHGFLFAPNPIQPIGAADISRLFEYQAATGAWCLHFSREQFLHSEGHPRFEVGSGPAVDA